MGRLNQFGIGQRTYALRQGASLAIAKLRERFRIIMDRSRRAPCVIVCADATSSAATATNYARNRNWRIADQAMKSDWLACWNSRSDLFGKTDNPSLNRSRGCLRPIVGAKLYQAVGHVISRCLVTDKQLFGNLFVGLSHRNECEHLKLPLT